MRSRVITNVSYVTYSLNIIIMVSNISIKPHIKYENVWTNNAVQQ